MTATVLVDHSWRGEWEVEIVGEGDRVACPTLAEAERLAYAAARRHRPSVVVVRDAYHRVLRRDLVDGAEGAPAGPAHAGGPGVAGHVSRGAGS